MRITYRRACLYTNSQAVVIEFRVTFSDLGSFKDWRCAPFRLEFLEYFPLRVVTDDFDVYEATKIKPLRPELRHSAIATGAILG